MLQKFLLVLCLVPTLAVAESVCLEGPSGGRCHMASLDGEVFKPARVSPDYNSALTSNTASKSNAISSNTKQVSNNNRRTFRVNNNVAEQRIRQRAQIIEARAQSKRNLSNM